MTIRNPKLPVGRIPRVGKQCASPSISIGNKIMVKKVLGTVKRSVLACRMKLLGTRQQANLHCTSLW